MTFVKHRLPTEGTSLELDSVKEYESIVGLNKPEFKNDPYFMQEVLVQSYIEAVNDLFHPENDWCYEENLIWTEKTRKNKRMQELNTSKEKQVC